MSWPRAIVFDLDGTLADSAPDIADALNIVMEEQGLLAFSLEQVKKMVGGGVPKLIERALGARERPHQPDEVAQLVPRFLEVYAPRAADKTRLFAGVREVLEGFHGGGIGLGVCTNKPEAVTRMMLERLGVAHLFGTVIGGDTLAAKKPDPGPVLEALARLDCEPRDGLMVGDSAADANAARATGVPVILVTFGYTQTPAHELENDGLVDSFEELGGTIANLRRALRRVDRVARSQA